MSDNIFDELEAMASAAGLQTHATDEIDSDAVHRWQRLFHFDEAQAEKAIREFRSDPNRDPRVALSLDQQWDAISPTAAGHDRESFEYFLHLKKTKKHVPRNTQDSATRTRNPNLRWIFVPTYPLETTNKVRKAFNATALDTGLDTDGKEFVICDAQLRNSIMSYLMINAPSTRPIFVAHSCATKDLSPSCLYPTLGIDTTLPQFRSSSTLPPTLPDIIHQNQYPVTYFFYGTLAEPDRLKRLLSLDEEPCLNRASVRGGLLTQWKDDTGKHAYNALVDSTAGPDSLVPGWSFQVESEAQELALRTYETAMYEVVRCQIIARDGDCKHGLTFRFVG